MLNYRKIIYYIRYVLLRMFFSNRKLNYKFSYNENRIEIINHYIKKFNNARYLEIGCADNLVFNSIISNSKVGVDPYMGGTFRGTSDEYFLHNKDSFDVIFVDGMHTFEQVFIDFTNAWNASHVGAYILFHDMLPKNYIEQYTPCSTPYAWTGDVWKLLFYFIEQNIDYYVYNNDHGVAVVKRTDIFINTNHEHLKTLDFNFYKNNFCKINIKSY
mgnify:CR=1 FL=1